MAFFLFGHILNAEWQRLMTALNDNVALKESG